MFLSLDLQQIGLMFGLFEDLLVLVFDFDVIFDLALDLVVLLGECALEQVDVVFLLVHIIVDTHILLLIPLQLLLQQHILLTHFGNVSLHFSHLSIDLSQSSLIVADGLCQFSNLMCSFLSKSAKPVMLVEQFLVLIMK